MVTQGLHSHCAVSQNQAVTVDVDCVGIDLDEARQLARSYYYPMTINPVRRVSRVTSHFHIRQVGSITLGDVVYDDDVRVSAGDLVTGYQVNVAGPGPLTSVHRRIAVTGDPGRAIVYQPSGSSCLEVLRAGCRVFTAKIDRTALENYLQMALDRQIDGPVDLAPSMDVSSGAGRSWIRLARQIAVDAADPDGLAHQPMMAERLSESLIVGLLVATDHPYREELLRPARHWQPRPVKRAIDAMAADPAHSFNVRELASAADVSVRALQAAFHRHTGVTPMAYLRDLRLAGAHDDLCRADPARETVAGVAHRWGFTHLSRFAAGYRQRYGVPPSVTLRL
jgi:AraC-like DNA-binding protein